MGKGDQPVGRVVLARGRQRADSQEPQRGLDVGRYKSATVHVVPLLVCFVGIVGQIVVLEAVHPVVVVQVDAEEELGPV